MIDTTSNRFSIQKRLQLLQSLKPSAPTSTKIKGRARFQIGYQEAPEHPYKGSNPTTFIRKLISDCDKGIKQNWQKKPIREPKERIEAVLGYRINGGKPVFPISRNNFDFEQHYKGEHTLYFTAANLSEYVLLMIDIDCHEKGTLQGAKQYAEYLREKFFDDRLYFEPSTNGNGIHCYCLLWTDEFTKRSDVVKDSMLRLQTLLQADFVENSLDEIFDVGEIDKIKGTPMLVDFQKSGDFDLTLGTLAKIPREVKTRFAEFRNTTVLNINDLLELPEYKELPKATKKAIAVKNKSGSTNLSFDWSRLPVYLSVANYLLTLQQPVCTNGLKVTAEDIAIFLLLFDAFSHEYRNETDEMPTERFLTHWQDAFQAGDLERAANHHRITAIRNMCSDLGLINWIDERYQFFTDGRKGTSCKWLMSSVCESLINQFQTALNVASMAVLNSSLRHTHNYMVGNKLKDKIRPVLMAIELTDRDKLLYFEQEALKICKRYEPPILDQQFMVAI